jgi:hypothetical protein
MDFPEIKETKAMRAAAANMLLTYRELEKAGRVQSDPEKKYLDARLALCQAAFDANPLYSAYLAHADGVESRQLTPEEFGAAKARFNSALQKIVSDQVQFLKRTAKLPDDFVLPATFENQDFYGTGLPPKGAEPYGHGEHFQRLTAARGEIRRG